MNPDRASLAEWLHDLEQRRARLEGEGKALVQRFRDAFAPGALGFRLVRLSGESNTLLRWRNSGSARRVPGARFELVDERELFVRLPPAVRAVLLEIEQRRIQLNHDYALAHYQVQRLRALAVQRRALAELRRLHREVDGVNPAPSR